MPTKVIVGTQWGDEGKGKVIDIMASRADVVVRSQGGNNAGHTIVNAGEVYKLHVIPSGILYDNTLCLVGAGVVIDPKSILGEIDGLAKRGISCKNVKIDYRAHIVMPWHITLDGASEKKLGNNEIGTTKRGIGPCYMDKAERSGIRFCDLIDEQILTEKIKSVGTMKNEIIVKIYDEQPIDLDVVIEEYIAYGKRLKEYAGDVSILAFNACKSGKTVLFEGAQATLLDLDFGTYPFVTSSHPVSGGVCTGTGIGPTMIDSVLGIAKAYTTRVGAGPFPTELLDEIGTLIRERGFEYGTTTGRPRRCGWFDAVVMRHSVRVNGLTGLAINKLDTLSEIENLKVCVAYELADGTIINDFPPSLEILKDCKPVYKEFKGFKGDLSKCKTFDELPQECKDYLAFIEEICGCKVDIAGVGPDRTNVLEK